MDRCQTYRHPRENQSFFFFLLEKRSKKKRGFWKKGGKIKPTLKKGKERGVTYIC
jgi:hypothetical protein